MSAPGLDLRAGLAFRRNPLRLLRSLDAGGELIRFRAGTTDFTVLKNPETIHRVLVTDAEQFGEGKWTLRGERVMGDCLITREGEPHRQRRAALQPGFDRGRLDAHVETIVRRALRAAERWQAPAEIECRGEMGRIALTASGEALFALDLEREAEALLPALWTMLSEIPKPGLPWPASRRLARARAVVEPVVASAVRERGSSASADGDVISRLRRGSENGGRGGALDDRAVVDEVISLLIASIDTTPGTLAWSWYLLATHPEVESQLHQELDAVLGERDPSRDDVGRLEHLERILNEVLRLYPPVHFIDRRPLRDVELDGERIAAGSFLLVSPLLTHRDPRFWPEPDRFDPERWRGQERQRPRYAYLPFGGGPHTCIGMVLARLELALVIATLARRFRLRPAPRFPAAPTPQNTEFPMRVEPH
jgi:cytochrome P450